MELKDVVLSTLAEMEDNLSIKEDLKKAVSNNSHTTRATTMEEHNKKEVVVEPQEVVEQDQFHSDEMSFLTSVRERLLVLFEGFQAPNNTQIEAKIDMTLNFLEYTLATIDNRIEKIKKGDK